MKYIIMCGGSYPGWNIPRQMQKIMGEEIVVRTIRLLRQCGVRDIYISTNDVRFVHCGVPLLHHGNSFIGYRKGGAGHWVEAFYPLDEPACYLMGDVVFSPQAIRTIVHTHTTGIEFFASAPPFSPLYTKPWAEPFAFKVMDQQRFRDAIRQTIEHEKAGRFNRRPIAWELWQVITGHRLNHIDYTSYIAINDYTCDVDGRGDVEKIEGAMKRTPPHDLCDGGEACL